MPAFNRQVHAPIVDLAFIVSVRKKPELDQREAAEIFGGSGQACRAPLLKPLFPAGRLLADRLQAGGKLGQCPVG